MIEATHAVIPLGAARPGEGTIHVGVVHAADGVRFLAASASRVGLACRIAEYVQQQASERLSGDDALRVHRLLQRGEIHAAIEKYFASVGKRWDEEWLHTDAVSMTTDEASPSLRHVQHPLSPDSGRV